MIGNIVDSSNNGGLAQSQAPRHVVGVIRSFRNLVAVVIGLLPAGAVRADDAVSEDTAAKVVVIPVREQIAKPELYILRRGLKEAIENKVDTIVLDMETPGGALDVTFEMLKALEKFPGKTVTYVNREAMSAGALISAGTDEIYFAPGSVIGAAAPVNATGEAIDPVMREKIVSYLKARVRSISEGKGYRGEVVSAPAPAIVRIAAESEPLDGSENNWHQISSPRTAGGTRASEASSVLCSIMAGSSMCSPVMK